MTLSLKKPAAALLEQPFSPKEKLKNRPTVYQTPWMLSETRVRGK